MIRLSKLTDYAIIILRDFAAHPERLNRSARDIAQATHIPVPTVTKVMKKLAKEGLLNSTRGASGGYVLSRASNEINVAEIIEALEGPIAITECNASESLCDQEPNCPVRDHWHVINVAIQGALQGIPLARMAQIETVRGTPLPMVRG